MSHRNLPRLAISFVILATILTAGVSAFNRTWAVVLPKPAPKPALGINLSGPSDWNTELPLCDVFRFSRTWISQRHGSAWGKGPALPFDKNGYVTALEPDCFAETPLCTIEDGHYPTGIYTVIYEGTGTIEFSKGRVLSTRPGRIEVEIDSAKGGFFLRLKSTMPKDHVRNIRVYLPGTEKLAQSNPWRPAFLKQWEGMACIRFMDLQMTNNSTLARWEDRPTLQDSTWTVKGLPVEMLCDLANRLKSDAWFCIPHSADDDYVRQFAKLVREKLDPNRRAYIEYSNEIWNSMFSQHRYAAAEGKRLGFSDKDWQAAWRYTGHRSVEIFKIWDTEFGDQARSRLVRVLPSQASNAYVSRQVAGWEKASEHADVLAIAPYLSMNVPQDGKLLKASQVAEWSNEQVFEHLEKIALPECLKWIADNRKVADEHGLKLVCYEAGQHLVGIGGAENNEKLTRLLMSANADPRMGELYKRYYAGWESLGGDLLCHFSSMGRWSKWGSWGLLQHYDDAPKKSPKLMETLNWAARLGQKVTVD